MCCRRKKKKSSPLPFLFYDFSFKSFILRVCSAFASHPQRSSRRFYLFQTSKIHRLANIRIGSARFVSSRVQCLRVSIPRAWSQKIRSAHFQLMCQRTLIQTPVLKSHEKSVRVGIILSHSLLNPPPTSHFKEQPSSLFFKYKWAHFI